jgi:hypothetical protein
MTNDEQVAPAAPPPLGPGDDDPKSAPAVQAVDACGPLAPGDDDPRSPVKVVGEPTARAPLAPGESDGHNPDDAFHFLAPPPPGPGDAHSGPRHVVRIPKQQSPPPTADTFEEE